MTEARRGNNVEVVATTKQAKQLRALGLKTKRKTTGGHPPSSVGARAAPDGSWDVYRPYFNDTYVGHGQSTTAPARKRDTLYEELTDARGRAPELVKSSQPRHDASTASRSSRCKVTKNAREIPDGQRPAIALLVDAARARVARHRDQPPLAAPVRRELRRHRPGRRRGRRRRSTARPRKRSPRSSTRTSCGSSSSPTRTATTTRSRPTTACGARTCATTTATARSRPTPTASTRTATSRRTGTTTTRARRATSRARPTAAPAPAPSPRRRRSDVCSTRVGFEMKINYHTAAELLLYPIGFQVETYTADDPIYRALSGTDADSAIKGNGRGRAGQLRPGRRRRALHHQRRHQRPSRTSPTAPCPGRRSSTSATPRAAAVAASSSSRTARTTSSAVFEKNIPFALDVAKSAKRSGQPRVAPGQRAPANFEVSHVRDLLRRPAGRAGQRQARARHRHHALPHQRRRREDRADEGVERRRALRRRLRRLLPPPPRRGEGHQAGRQGPRLVRGRRQEVAVLHLHAGAGDQQPGADPGLGGLHRPQPGLRQQDRPELPELLPAGACRPTASATTSGTPTPAAARAPDALGVLSHYKAIVWYTGDNERTIEPDQPPAAPARRSSPTTSSGRSATSSTRAASCSTRARRPAGTCRTSSCSTSRAARRTATTRPFRSGACIPLSNDFLQYYLGSCVNNSLRDPANAPTDEDAAEQQADLDNMDIDFFDPMAAPTAKLNGPDSANNQTPRVHAHADEHDPAAGRVPAVQVRGGR